MARVQMYGTRWCPYCTAARRLLDAKGVSYEDIRVDEAPARRVEMRARGGGRTVPQIWVGDVHVGGFTELAALENDGRLDALLAEAS